VDGGTAVRRYLQPMVGEPTEARTTSDEVRRLVPVFALAVAIIAASTDSASALDLVLMAIPVAAFAIWAYRPGVPLAVLAFAVLVPVTVVQRSGAHEPIMFEASLLAVVVARWSSSLALAAALGLLALAAPAVVGAIDTRGDISVGIWILGIAFPWVIGRAILRQSKLAAQLDATRRELAQQAMLEERRRIARDVHDFVGHGLAAMMLQVTSARHVLRRDPGAAEEALRSAEDVGRRSMGELRRTVALLRSDDDTAVPPPPPSAIEVPALVDRARTGGLAVTLQMRGDVASISPGAGLAVYRIAQEALANAARHAPQARTALAIELCEEHVSLVAETTGPILPVPEGDRQRSRYGVIGMRERAIALGGELTAGPTAAGWRVSCRLPLEDQEVSPNGAVGPGRTG
jgi:signal transduction histidine kinase